jgi:hypothetical protein
MSDKLRSASRWLAAFVIAVSGCTSGDNVASPGKVSLEFVGISDSAVTVALVNGRGHAIYLRGVRKAPSEPIEIMSVDSAISCMTLPTSSPTTPEAYAALFGVADGIGEWPYAEVPANGRATVVIDTRFPQQHHGSRCGLQLRLKDGTEVGTAELEP